MKLMADTFVSTAQMQAVKRGIEVSCLNLQLPLLDLQTAFTSAPLPDAEGSSKPQGNKAQVAPPPN